MSLNVETKEKVASTESKSTDSKSTDAKSSDEKETKQEVKGLGDIADETDKVKLVLGKTKEATDMIVKYAKLSIVIKTALETDAESKEIAILGGITSVTFKDLVKYMEASKGVEQPIAPKPLRSKVMKETGVAEWAAAFIDEIGEDRQRLYDFILGANYLDIKCALHLGCAKVASLIKGQPLEKIKEILSKGITPKDKTKEQVEDVVMSFKEEKKSMA